MRDTEEGGKNDVWKEVEQCYCPWQNERIGQVVKERGSRVPFLARR